MTVNLFKCAQLGVTLCKERHRLLRGFCDVCEQCEVRKESLQRFFLKSNSTLNFIVILFRIALSLYIILWKKEDFLEYSANLHGNTVYLSAYVLLSFSFLVIL